MSGEAPGGAPSGAVLEGIKVVDFGQYVAGPLAAMLLADQGAEVVRVDPPGGPRFDSPANSVFNRGKKSVVLDLKGEEGLRTARRLVASADVVVENFRPGVMGRLGLGPERATAENPGLVYLSLPGFSASDEERSSVAAWEGVVGAATGLYAETNVLRGALGLPPVYTALPLPSVYGAVHGALAVVMAILAREDDGQGDAIEVPLAGAAMSGLGSILFRVAKQPARYDIPPMPRLVSKAVLPAARRVIAARGQGAQERVYRAAQKVVPPLMDNYRCADGRLLYVFAMDHARLPTALLRELGLLDGFRREGLTEKDPYEHGLSDSNLMDVSSLSLKWRRKLRGGLAAVFGRSPAAEWEARLGAAGVPCAVQRTTREWLDLSHPRESGLVVEVQDGRYGKMRQPGAAAWVGDSTKTHPPPRPAPALDSDRAAVLRDLDAPKGASHEAPLAARGARGAPERADPRTILRGVRILDLSSMISGPSCARTLAEYGAEVIKIDSPTPLHGPRMTCWYGIEVNQGKRSALVDLGSAEGREAFWRLVDSADVVVHNFRRGVAERLGIGYAEARKRKPGIVYCAISAYGGPEGGPWAGRAGYDPVLQAATGVMSRYGDPDRPELHAIASCVDYVTGYLAAFGVALALLGRRRRGYGEGVGSSVQTSLAQGAQLAQATFVYDFDGRAWDEPAGQSALGAGALQRMYRAKDGWLFLGATGRQLRAMDKIEGLTGVDGLAGSGGTGATDEGDGPLGDFLADRIRRRGVRYWVRELTRAGVGAHRVEKMDDIRRSDLVEIEDGREEPVVDGRSVLAVRQLDHPVGGAVDTAAPAYARFARSRVRRGRPAPRPGSNTGRGVGVGRLLPGRGRAAAPRGPRFRGPEQGLPARMSVADPARGNVRPLPSYLSTLNERYPRKRAFVTGCASGLGRALCKELATAGWALGMNDVDAGALAAAVEEVEAIGGDPRGYAFDVAGPDEFRAAASDFVRRNGGVDLVFNNAGLGAGGFFDGYPLEHWREVVDVNLMGVVHGCHVFLPAMKRARSGRIVNVASAAAFHGLPQVSAYNATKAAVLALSETLEAELRGTGVGMSVMISTFFRSEIAKNTRGTDAEKRKTQGLVDASKLSAEEAARRTLSGVAKNRFYIVMPLQARVIWSFKRHLPRLYLGVLPPLARALDARLGRAGRG